MVVLFVSFLFVCLFVLVGGAFFLCVSILT